MKNFVLIGAAGYIAPKHLQAIKETGNNLIAALDKHDSVGILDSYFPEADFFTEFERFDRYCEKLRRSGTAIHYVSVCSPNYLHDAHIRFGLRIGADVICEKPVVLNPWNVDALTEMEKETGKKVYVIHQLRYHPSIIALRKKVLADPPGKIYKVELQYITPRGKWYQYSWKGDVQKSGGITTNIGLHFFDILLWIFGEAKEKQVVVYNDKTASGRLILEKANVNWLLSIDEQLLPEQAKIKGEQKYRTLTVNDELIEFSKGLDELHTQCYEAILTGKGIQLGETKKTIELIHDLRLSVIR